MHDDVHGFLPELGRRLRRARERAGLSLTETAGTAGVSRRYVTEAEAGRANPSVLVLLRLARALRVGLPDLLSIEDSGGGARAGERLALVGLRGAGKSTVGRRLARRLEVPLIELDRRVEELAGLSLGEIFDLYGSVGFHRWEAEALERVLAEGERMVIATGGSIAARETTFARLRATCRTIWLRATPEEHYQRVAEQGDRRPMRDRPRAMDELRALLVEREPLYRRCELIVDTSGRTPDEVADEILARVDPSGLAG